MRRKPGAHGVFPIVGTLRIFRVIFDTHRLGSIHVAPHDLLFHATDLHTHGILAVAHVLDAVGGEIALGAARVADGHGKIAVFIALQRHGSPVFGMIGNIVFTVGGGAIGLRVGIDAED